jgi:hypothetical protein
MSIRVNGVGNYIGRTAGLIPYNALYSVRTKIRIVNNTANYSHFFAASFSAVEESGDYTASDFLGTGADGLTLRIGAYHQTNGGVDGNGSTLSVGVDYDLMLVRESISVLKAYLNGVLDATATNDMTGRTAIGGMYMGQFNAGYHLDGRISNVIMWNDALSLAEIRAQVNQVEPIRVANLISHNKSYKGATERLFDEVHGYNWTAFGTLTDEAGPTIPISSRPRRRTFQSAGGSPTGSPWYYYAQQ